jgi:hypothetical protein
MRNSVLVFSGSWIDGYGRASSGIMAFASRIRAWIIALGILVLVVLIGVRFMASESQSNDFDFQAGQKSVHDVSVTVPRNKWDTYFTQMKEFAKENSLQIRIARVHPDHDVFFVDMWRGDIALVGGNVFDSPEFVTGFYIDQTKGGTVAAADVLVESMKQTLANVPGIVVAQTK